MRTPLVLLPGSLCDGTLWRHQVEHLSELAEVRVGDLTQDDTIAGMARTVLAAAPDRFALAGLSMGGIVALEIMRQVPERVTRLALLDTNPRAPGREQIAARQQFIALAESGGFREITERHLLPVLIHPDRQQNAGLKVAIIQMAENVGPEACVRQMQALISRPDSRPRLSHIACPTLVLVGRQDALGPVPWHEEMAAAIPEARLVVIEQCGHLSSLEQPQAVTAVLRYWLQVE